MCQVQNMLSVKLFLLLLMVVTIRNVATLNINCLRSRAKQILLRDLVSAQSLDILFLQEVNITNFDFLGPQFHSIVNVGTEERGTAIIFRAGIRILNVETHTSGRITSVLTEDKTLYLNVYLPSGTNKRTEREDMLNNVIPNFVRIPYNNTVIGGDFNCVMHPKDQRGTYHPSQGMERLYTELQLRDVWEHVYNNNVQYTFFRGNSASRLDRFYVNKQQISSIYNTIILPVAFSDHHCLKLQMKIEERAQIYGRGYWKLNTRLLSIEDIKEDFKLRWKFLEDRASRSHESDLVKWFKIYKPGIQSFFKGKGVEEARKRRSQMEHYYILLNELHTKQQAGENVESRMKAVQRRIIRLQETQMEGNIIRARKKTVMEDEKGSLYFIAAVKKAANYKYIDNFSPNKRSAFVLQ